MSTFEDLEAEDVENNHLERFEEDEDGVEGGDENNHEDGVEGENEAAEGVETADDSSKKAVKPKRVVRNPQPKLNVDTLKTKRGLIALESHFERVKFKGRGHEEEDLSVILKTYEYWCHRLFPKYPFDECISKIENLGKKRPVGVYVKRLRANLPYDYGPEILNRNDNSDNEDESIIGNNDFDELMDVAETQAPVEISEEQMERIRQNREKAEEIRRGKLRQETESFDAPSQSEFEFLEQTQMEVTESLDEPSSNFQENNQPQPPVEISEEQLERIRLNKERAKKIRREREERGQERELSEASGSQGLQPYEEHETLNQEVTESEREPNCNPQENESNYISQVEPHNENVISQVEQISEEKDISDNEASNDAGKLCKTSEMETDDNKSCATSQNTELDVTVEHQISEEAVSSTDATKICDSVGMESSADDEENCPASQGTELDLQCNKESVTIDNHLNHNNLNQ